MSIRVVSQILRRRKRQQGTATIEFSILMLFFLMPMMFGILEASEAMTVNRRVATTVNTLADLTAQSETIRKSELGELIDAAISMLEQQDTSGVTATVISVAVVDDEPQVRWSLGWANDGVLAAPPYAEGDKYTGLEDEETLDPDASLVIVELVYPHSLLFPYYFSPQITFDRESIRYPRLVDRVELCENDLSVCYK